MAAGDKGEGRTPAGPKARPRSAGSGPSRRPEASGTAAATTEGRDAGIVRAGRAEIDLGRGELRRDGVQVPLRRKAWQLLVLLASRPGTVVASEEIALALWPDTTVSAQGIFTVVSELREALGGRAPSRPVKDILTTVRGRGYRLDVETPGETTADSAAATLAPLLPSAHPCFVGRERELRVIASELERARRGEPRIVFVAGESGIGKTTLVNEALAAVASRDRDAFVLARGACLQRRGEEEPYGPLLDAFAAWARHDEADRSSAFRLAPLWADRILAPTRSSIGPLAVLNARPGVMVQQATEFLRAAGRARLHVLVLEDAHWADVHTLEFVRTALPRLGPAHLLVLVTYRERDALQRGVAVDRAAMDLRDHGSLLDLGPLSDIDARRLALHHLGDDADESASRVCARAAGNPLFLEAFAGHALYRDGAGATPLGDDEDLPRMFSRVVEAQWESLSTPAKAAIEAGAILGQQFDVATVASALGASIEEIDALLAKRAERPSFLIPAGVTTKAGALRTCYRFRHESFRRVVRDSIAPIRAGRLHGATGRALAADAASPGGPRASVIAGHLLLGGEHSLAADWFERFADECVHSSLVAEAATALAKALECVRCLSPGKSRDRRELRLVIRHGLTCGWLRGPADEAVQRAYEEGLPLLERVEDPDIVGPAMRGIWLMRLVRFDYTGMLEVADRMAGMPAASTSTLFRRQAACLRGMALVFLGRQREALPCIESARSPRARRAATADVWGLDLDVEIACCAAWTATYSGKLGLAAERLEEARRLAARADHAGSSLLVRWFEFSLAQLLGRSEELPALLDAFSDIARRENQQAWDAIAATLRATLELERGHADALQLLMETLGGGDGQPTLLIARAYLLGQLAAAVARSGHGAEGLGLVDAALSTISRNHGRVSESDFWRIKGQIHERMGDLDAAAAALERALEISREQGAAIFERRAAVALAGLHARAGRRGEAEALLAGIADRFAPRFSVEEAAAIEPLSPLPPAVEVAA